MQKYFFVICLINAKSAIFFWFVFHMFDFAAANELKHEISPEKLRKLRQAAVSRNLLNASNDSLRIEAN